MCIGLSNSRTLLLLESHRGQLTICLLNSFILGEGGGGGRGECSGAAVVVYFMHLKCAIACGVVVTKPDF